MGSRFWGFSLAVYGADAVEPECLRMQDEFGLDVNLILLCAFIGAVRSVALTADDIAAARAEVGEWHDNIVKSLRAARRRLKTVELRDARVAEAAMQLRARVKAAELESEYIEHLMLERWAEARLAARPCSEPPAAVATNLQALLAAHGIGPERLDASHAMPHLIAASLNARS